MFLEWRTISWIITVNLSIICLWIAFIKTLYTFWVAVCSYLFMMILSTLLQGGEGQWKDMLVLSVYWGLMIKELPYFKKCKENCFLPLSHPFSTFLFKFFKKCYKYFCSGIHFWGCCLSNLTIRSFLHLQLWNFGQENLRNWTQSFFFKWVSQL